MDWKEFLAVLLVCVTVGVVVIYVGNKVGYLSDDVEDVEKGILQGTLLLTAIAAGVTMCVMVMMQHPSLSRADSLLAQAFVVSCVAYLTFWLIPADVTIRAGGKAIVAVPVLMTAMTAISCLVTQQGVLVFAKDFGLLGEPRQS